jgi:hypothetical protein
VRAAAVEREIKLVTVPYILSSPISRRFKDMGAASGEEIRELAPTETVTRVRAMAEAPLKEIASAPDWAVDGVVVVAERLGE